MTKEEQTKAIYDAVFETMGISPEDVMRQTKVREIVFSRCIIVVTLLRLEWSVEEIEVMLGLKTPSMVIYYTRLYDQESSPYFVAVKKKIADKLGV